MNYIVGVRVSIPDEVFSLVCAYQCQTKCFVGVRVPISDEVLCRFGRIQIEKRNVRPANTMILYNDTVSLNTSLLLPFLPFLRFQGYERRGGKT